MSECLRLTPNKFISSIRLIPLLNSELQLVTVNMPSSTKAEKFSSLQGQKIQEIGRSPILTDPDCVVISRLNLWNSPLKFLL
jgi:hypothetical protein